jgi:glycosyltransferase 2 family protein
MGPAPEASRRRIPSWLPQTLAYALSVACLIWVLHDFPLSRIGQEIQSLDWRWVSLGVVADLATYVAHAWRWNILFRPFASMRLWRTAQIIYIGLFANEVLPLRTGEVIRVYLMSHWNNLRLSVVFASAGVERLIDGVWMILSFVITASFVRGIPSKMVLFVQALGVVVVVGTGVLMWIARRKPESHAPGTLRHMIEGLQLMGSLRTLTGAALVSLLYLALQFVTVWALMKAAHFDYSFWVASGVITLVRLGVVVPNAPGNLGVFQVACVLALKLFEAQEDDAKSFAFIMWFALTLPLLIGGAVATALSGLKLGELRERAKRSASAVEAEP